MKLRIHRNQIRLRLILNPTQNSQEITASFSVKQITVSLPKKIAEDWASTDLVGISHPIHISNDNELAVLIKKDFQCLH